MIEDKVVFYYEHYTRDFRNQDVLVECGTLTMEFFPECPTDSKTMIVNQMTNIFARVLHRFGIIVETEKVFVNFSAYEFYEISGSMSNPNRIWQKELGRKGDGDFIRVTTTFPAKIQERYEKEWDNYQDYLSCI